MSEAKKPLIFVTPVPHVGDFGDSSNARWPTLLSSLKTALWAGDAIGKSVAEGLTLGRKAIGGFSHGAKVAMAALVLHPEAVDELYLFDPPKFGQPQTGPISAWLRRGGKRLRLIGGGAVHGEMIAFAAGKGPTVTVNPASADYWLKSPLYLAALPQVRFDPSTAAGPSPGSLSGSTGLFFVGPVSRGIGVAMQGRTPNNATVVRSRDVPGIGHEELAADARAYADCFAIPSCRTGLLLTGPAIPISNSAQFDQLVSVLTKRIRAMRHQWTVMGGEDTGGKTDRLATFKGFLQLCIEQGNFP